MTSHRRGHGNVSEEDRIVDWTLCCLFQEQIKKKLQWSTAATLSDPQKTYRKLADGMKTFQSIEMMLMPLNVIAMECDTDLSQSLHANSDKFRKSCKSCKLRFAQVKLDRAIKLVEEEELTPTSVKDSKRGNFITYCCSWESTWPFSPQRFPTSLLALNFLTSVLYSCLQVRGSASYTT